MTFAPLSAKRYALRQARVLGRMLPEPIPPVDFDGFAIVDILVDEGAITKIAPTGVDDFGEAPEVAMSGRIVLPLFVDVHTHLDKGHIWRRKRNRVGDFPSAVAATVEDGHSHPYRQRRAADENQLAGPG
jgi:cytosine deaminase